MPSVSAASSSVTASVSTRRMWSRSTSSSRLASGGAWDRSAGPKMLSGKSSCAIVSPRQHHGPFDRVAQLADVARPSIAAQRRRRFGRELQSGAAVAQRRRGKKPLGQRRDVLGALAQSGHRQADYIKAVKKVVAKPPRRDFLLQDAIGRRDDSRIHLDCVRAADPLETPLL